MFVKILTHLSPFAIVFVLASELVVFEALEDLGHPLGGVGQHGLQGHPGGEFAVLGEGEHSCGEDHGNNLVIRRALAEKNKNKKKDRSENVKKNHIPSGENVFIRINK